MIASPKVPHWEESNLQVDASSSVKDSLDILPIFHRKIARMKRAKCALQLEVVIGVLAVQAALAGGEAWSAYWELFVESRFVHVTTTDFAALSLFAPFWMWNDAEKRQWQGRYVPLKRNEMTFCTNAYSGPDGTSMKLKLGRGEERNWSDCFDGCNAGKDGFHCFHCCHSWDRQSTSL